MEPLSPRQAAEIAFKVYAIETRTIEEALSGVRDFRIDESFSMDRAQRFEGVSGGTFFKSTSGFGYVVGGTGIRKSEALIAIRGTSPLVDYVTDFNVAVDAGPSGHLVHAGFNRVFDSFKFDLSRQMDKLKPVAVHVVGHSLGGALATLTADYLHQKGIKIKLYTFGAPRSGAVSHSHHMTKCLPAENIYRVYHSADPVTMIPIFPFQHIPVTDNAYFLPCNGRIDFQAHRILNYLKSVGEAGWRGLSGLSPAPGLKKQVEEYVQSLDSEGTVMLSAASLRAILRALDAVINEAGLVVGGLFLVAGATLIDRMAQLLYTGILASVKIAAHVRKLMIAILKFLGRSVDAGTQITVAFMSWVLNMLFKVISGAAVRALNLAQSAVH